MSIVAQPCYPKADLLLLTLNGRIRVKLYKDSKWSWHDRGDCVCVWKGITYLYLSYHDFFKIFHSSEQIYTNLWERCKRCNLLEPDAWVDFIITDFKGGINK